MRCAPELTESVDDCTFKFDVESLPPTTPDATDTCPFPAIKVVGPVNDWLPLNVKLDAVAVTLMPPAEVMLPLPDTDSPEPVKLAIDVTALPVVLSAPELISELALMFIAACVTAVWTDDVLSRLTELPVSVTGPYTVCCAPVNESADPEAAWKVVLPA